MDNKGEFKVIEDSWYVIYRDGRVYSNESKRFLATHKTRNGYECISLIIGGKQQNRYIHRLISTAFIPNPDNKPQVNHKNGIKTDNRVENLEWNTSKENIRHAFEAGLYQISEKHISRNQPTGGESPNSKKVKQFTLEGRLVKVWACIIDIHQVLGIHGSNISKACKGKLKTAGGFKWEYF